MQQRQQCERNGAYNNTRYYEFRLSSENEQKAQIRAKKIGKKFAAGRRTLDFRGWLRRRCRAATRPRARIGRLLSLSQRSPMVNCSVTARNEAGIGIDVDRAVFQGEAVAKCPDKGTGFLED